MIGAASCDIKYTGVDTNKKTVKGLRNIIDFLQLKKCKVYNAKGETFKAKKTYDAVFTCPPYFDTEIYEGKNTSTNLYKTYEEWLKWWKKLVKNSLRVKPKYFAFVINNQYNEE